MRFASFPPIQSDSTTPSELELVSIYMLFRCFVCACACFVCQKTFLSPFLLPPKNSTQTPPPPPPPPPNIYISTFNFFSLLSSFTLHSFHPQTNINLHLHQHLLNTPLGFFSLFNNDLISQIQFPRALIFFKLKLKVI